MADTTDALVDIKTSMGDIRVRLYGDTPLHRDNFLKLVNDGFYDGVIFHRVINDFMVQTGDPESKNAPQGAMVGSGGPGYQIDAEIVYPKHFHKRGALAAARQGDYVNPERRSSGSQFYIVTGRVFPSVPATLPDEIREAYSTVGGTPHLDGGYTVFGEVVSGMDVVDNIQKVATDGNDRPLDDVKIISMTVVE